MSYTGTASIDNGLIEKYIAICPLVNESPTSWLLQLATFIKSKMTENDNTVFTLCGYYYSKRIVISTNTKNLKIKVHPDDQGIVFSGESNYISHLINYELVVFDYGKFTMQDSVDFLRFLVKTVSGLMQFGQCLPTVSEECDILAIYSNNAYWVQHSVLH